MQHDKTAHQQMADDGASMPWQNHHSHHHYYSPSSPSKKAAYGKILPRLPEGTRCGGLVMSKYGLYNPQVRALQEECYPKMLAGVPTERINRNQEIIFQMCKWMVILSVFISAHNFAMMLYGTKEKPLWPYTLFMEKSD
ncbi:hypothetical protein niasHT_032962 [Heterodera trifolii]|uniref:Uncharacterized protein n=1 Tax=Heterodera trifolii TaxID=157864 RepID=A0ABD2HTW4_9BILA